MFSLIKYELKKLFAHKIIPIMLLLITVFNVLLISSQVDEKAVLAEKQLDALLADYNADPEGMEKKMQEFVDEYDRVSKHNLQCIHTGEARLPYPDSTYSDKDYTLFSKTFPELKNYTTTYQKTIKMSIRIANGHIDEYRYLGYAENSFEIAYQQGVLKSYDLLKDMEFPITNIRGYDVFLDYSGFGVIAMIAMIVGGMLILIPEKSGGMVGILRVSKRGRTATYIAKMIVAFVYCLLVCLVLTLSALATVGVCYGYNGIDAPLQMVESFRLCPLMTTVGGGLVLTFLLRLFSCFVFMVAIVALSAVFTGYVPAFSIGILFTALNYLAATKDYLNAYDPLKNLNFFWSINGKEPLVYWRGINLFDICVPTLESVLLVYSVILVVSLLLAWFFYTAGKGLEFRALRNLSRKISVAIKNALPGRKSRKRATLIGYEIKKILTPFSCLILAGLIVGTVLLTDDAFRVKRKTFYELTYAEYMEEYGGEWTEQKDAALKAEYAEFIDILSQEEEMYFKYKNKEIDFVTYHDYTTKNTYAENRIEIVQSLSATSDTLRKLNEEGKLAYFVNEMGWNRMINTNISYLYLAAIILLFSGVYAVEYKDKFMQIQSTTRNGKLRTTLNKFAIVSALTVLTVACCEAWQYYVCFTEHGLPLPNAPAISLPALAEASGTIGGHFALIFLRQIGVALAAAFATVGVSRLTKKFLPTLAIMGMIAFAPTLFGYFGFDFLQELSLLNFLGRA